MSEPGSQASGALGPADLTGCSPGEALCVPFCVKHGSEGTRGEVRTAEGKAFQTGLAGPLLSGGKSRQPLTPT
jgi:hypothetical protein